MRETKKKKTICLQSIFETFRTAYAVAKANAHFLSKGVCFFKNASKPIRTLPPDYGAR